MKYTNKEQSEDYGIQIDDTLTIPIHELVITTSRSGGAGGQHVNKTDTQVHVKWHIANSKVLTQEQKERLLTRLNNKLTEDGFLTVKNSATRSQLQNKKLAYNRLTQIIKQALIVPKKRTKTTISKTVKEKRLRQKKMRSEIKRLRRSFD